jgi:hypothetical protein
MKALAAMALAILLALGGEGRAQVPDALVAPGEVPMLTVHAEGAQIYECKADPAGRLTWQFREPIAALMVDGKTVGRHYTGPCWEFADGDAVTGNVVARAPGASDKDIPLLRLEVTSRRGAGQLSAASAVQRINTRGGAAGGSCERSGVMLSVPYSADYVFLRKGS